MGQKSSFPRFSEVRLRSSPWSAIAAWIAARTAIGRAAISCVSRRCSICQSAGTPIIACTFPFSSASPSRSAVNSSRYVISAPRSSGTSRPQVNSKVWCSGSTLSSPWPTRSSNSVASFEVSEAKFLCVRTTPFGLPVVPLVKSTEATSSAAAVLRRGCGSPGTPRSSSGKVRTRNPAGRSPRRSSARGEAIRMRARAASAQLPISWSDICASSGAAVAPALRTPKYAIAHSGRFSERSRTRSPARTPSWSSLRAARSEKAPSSS